MPSSRTALPVAAAAALVLALPGCGADRGGGSERRVADGETIEVSMDEYRFEPQDLITRTGRFRVRAVNEGSLAHNWRIVEGERDVAGTETFQGGGERTTEMLDIPPGTYRIICTVGNHADLGMAGMLRVGGR